MNRHHPSARQIVDEIAILIYFNNTKKSIKNLKPLFFCGLFVLPN